MMESDSLPNTSFPLSKSEFIGPKNTELTSLTIGQYFKRVVDNYADHPAIVVRHQNINWTVPEGAGGPNYSGMQRFKTHIKT